MTDIEELEKKVEEKKQQEISIFEKKEEKQELAVVDKKEQLVEDMFEQAVIHQISNNDDLKENVLTTAETYTKTKMKTIQTNVETENKEAEFNNKKDACESYGFNEKTTPIWATRFMSFGYNIMLAIYLFIASFTVMPVIFLMKKIQVAVKKGWIAIIMALIVYLGVTFVPILLGILNS